VLIPIVAHAVPPPPPVVALKGRCPHKFRVVRLGRSTRWFRERGYVVPILSGDRTFDERWAVQADDCEFTEALVRAREARAAIARLDELGFNELGHSRTQLYVTPSKSAKGEELKRRDEAIRGQLAVLEGLITRLCRQRQFPHHDSRRRVAGLAILLGVALAAGLAGLAFGSSDLLTGELGPLALRSLLASLPLALVLSFALARLLAGRSRSGDDLAIVLVLAWLALPVAGVGAAATINRWADSGPVAVRRLLVLEVRHKRDENKHYTHYAVVPDWSEGGGTTRRIKLRGELAQRAVAGQSQLRLTTSPGWFGAERLLDLALEGAEPGS
jgi:hypothetical protein